MLTPKQTRFIDEYLIDLNGTQAAIRAGYSPKAAEVQASVLLRNPNVREVVDRRMADLQRRTGITQEAVLGILWTEAQGGGPDTTSSARVRAAELLGKHQGMFVDRVQHEGNERKPIRFIEVLGSEPEPAEPNAGE